jgi:single-stranded DNA-specific DHH superfamily exonuclease
VCGLGLINRRSDSQGLDSYDIGFAALVLNAAGRMGRAGGRAAHEHQRRAKQLPTTSRNKMQRQQCERKMLKHACELVIERGLNHDHNIVCRGGWHTGVLGIVASGSPTASTGPPS